MGMFDTVLVSLNGCSQESQTKDLDNCFDYYLVNEEGIHIKRDGKFHKVPWINGDIQLYYLSSDTNYLVYFTLTFKDGELF